MNIYNQILESMSSSVMLLGQDLSFQYLNESAQMLIQGSAARARKYKGA